MCFAAVRHRLLGNFALLPSRTAMCRKNKQKWLYVQAMGIIFGAERIGQNCVEFNSSLKKPKKQEHQ